jgi:hypothetical protein
MTDARALTLALRGRWSGLAGMARCPLHDDRTPSLSIRNGDQDVILVTCFAGCKRESIIAELRRRGFLDSPAERVFKPKVRASRSEPHHKPDPEALDIWRGGKPSIGSIVERYLRLRGIRLAVPVSLRCRSKLHLGRYDMPTMIAAVQAPGGAVIAVQETLLTLEARRAAVAVPRITTGALGYGAVRLAKADDVLGLAEGIETALSAMQLTGVPCWACLGANRMARVAIPDCVRELHIFADADDAGRAAADQTSAAHKGHRRVLVRFPNGGKDWNDAPSRRSAA